MAMARQRRTRAEWKKIVAEAKRIGSVTVAAERYGVRPKTLSWWAWTLGRDVPQRPRKSKRDARLLPVIVAQPAASPEPASSRVKVELAAGVRVSIDVGTDVAYVAALASALHRAC